MWPCETGFFCFIYTHLKFLHVFSWLGCSVVFVTNIVLHGCCDLNVVVSAKAHIENWLPALVSRSGILKRD